MRKRRKSCKIRNPKNNAVGGYFTVEAALLFPFVMGVILLVIYMFFFQYDRCLMEQSAAVLAMRGCTLQIVDTAELVQEMVRQGGKEDRPYVAWEVEEVRVQTKGNAFIVTRNGRLKFPFRGLDFWNGSIHWEDEARYENHRIRPVTFIRNYRKLGGN